MSCDDFNDSLSTIKSSQDKTNLLHALLVVRKQIEWPRDKDNMTKLREEGCLRQLVSSLLSSHKKSLDVSLSILGNCCMDNYCARDLVGQFNIFSNLNLLLKRYPKEDSINGRIFRILGNICNHMDQWATILIDKKPQIILHVVKYLIDVAKIDDENENIASEATVNMAIRFLRLTLNNQTFKPLVKTHKVLNPIGMLLIKYSVKWQQDKSHENILNNIIRLLQGYSRYKYYYAILELRNTEKGDSIICLGKILLLCPKKIVKIIMNFIKISQLKSDLPIPEIFETFIEILRNNSIVKDFNEESEDCIKCLCCLLDHPANRDHERCGRSISLLVDILGEIKLTDNKKIECNILILSTLNKCKYDDSLILEQINCNIISVLIEKFKWIVGNIDKLDVSHESERKRKYRSDEERSPKKNERFSLVDIDGLVQCQLSSSDDEVDYNIMATNSDRSPASSSSESEVISWASGLSPQASPRSNFHGLSESDSDDYSPVCSEADVNDLPVLNFDEEQSLLSESEKLSDLFDGCEDNNKSDMTDLNAVINIKMILLMEILKLLRTYIKLRPAVPQLGTPDLLQAIIKSSVFFQLPHSHNSSYIVDVVYRILESHDYLLPLMQTDFIPMIYNLLNMQHGNWCVKCNQFQHVANTVLNILAHLAESGVGKGEIAHKLLRGDNATKKQLVLVIPYIVRNKSILSKLMLNCGGLEILMKLIRDESDLKVKGIKVLCVMALKKLGIPNPKEVKNNFTLPVTVIGEYALCDNSSIVTFKLDDGSVVKADRFLLSKTSDFFSKLLNGGFKESTEDVIRLPNVQNKSMSCLLTLLKCDLDKTKPMKIGLELDVHLDIIALCDRFLMSQLCVYLVDCVEKFRLSFDTLPVVYQWSLESGTNILRVECIAFALVADIVDAERLKMFENLFELGCTDVLVEDIRKLLVRYMSLTNLCEAKSKNRRRSFARK